MSLLYGYDPPLDESVTLRCEDDGCPAGGETFHPELEHEYQGDYPHGGVVAFYVEGAFDCPECGKLGKEITP